MALVPAPDKPSLRTQQAALTRARVLGAAHDSFIAVGWAGTTVQAVADGAGVSLQTVYNTVGGKAALLKAVYDRAVAGDDEPVTIAERAQVAAMRAMTDPGELLDAYADLGRQLAERAAPLSAVVLSQAGAGEPAVRAWVATIDAERATGTRRVAEHLAAAGWLRPGVDLEEAADVLWAVTAPEVAVRLAVTRGWGWRRYGGWLALTLRAALLP